MNDLDRIAGEIEVEMQEFDREIEEAIQGGWMHLVEATTRSRQKRELQQACWRGFKTGLMLQPPHRQKEAPEQKVLRAIKNLRGDVKVARGTVLHDKEDDT